MPTLNSLAELGTAVSVFDSMGQRLRVITKDGEPWFVAADVCAALTIGNTSMAMERLDDDEKGISSIDTLGGKQEFAIINESGLYNLILGSRKPEAKRFKKWVTSEVLPSIRKTGGYRIPQASSQVAPEVSLLSTKLALASLFQIPLHLAQIEAVKQVRSEVNVDLSPWLRLAPAQDFVAVEDVMLEPTELGEHFGISAVKMNRMLAAADLQERDVDGWVPTHKARAMCAKHSWTKGSKSGYNLKWNLERVRGALSEMETV